MYNIKQLTNFDVKDNTIEEKTFFVGGETSITHNYRIIPYNQLLGLVGGENDLIISINKLGYCVNSNQGINYPIYITFEDGAEETFYIGKTGIFEFQPEEWTDVNDDKIERTATVSVKRILVPDNVSFVLDYCFVI